ncbi:hypothetical protein [Eubacterium sp.]
MNNPYKLAEKMLNIEFEHRDVTGTDGFNSIDLYGSSVSEKDNANDNHSSFHLENESGYGDNSGSNI